MKFLKIVLFAFLITFAYSYYDDIKNFQIVRVYDGDTFFINIPGYPDIAGKNIKVRIRGIDTPEMRSKRSWTEIHKLENKIAAVAAKQFLVSLFSQCKNVELRNTDRGKYFRILADVYVDGVNVADLMVLHGHAVRYDGGTKEKVVAQQMNKANSTITKIGGTSSHQS